MNANSAEVNEPWRRLSKNEKLQIEIAVAIVEFIEVLIHTVLHRYNVYSPQSFVTQQYLGIPIQVCVHGGVSRYVHSQVKQFRELLPDIQDISVHLFAETHLVRMALKQYDLYFDMETAEEFGHLLETLKPSFRQAIISLQTLIVEGAGEHTSLNGNESPFRISYTLKDTPSVVSDDIAKTDLMSVQPIACICSDIFTVGGVTALLAA